MRPPCECHGEPMYWHKNDRLKAGGHWRCVVKKREAGIRYDQSEKGRKAHREAIRRYDQSEKGREAHARHMRGKGYVTRRRRELSSQRERITNQLEVLKNGLV